MTDRLPTATVYPLPVSELRAPLTAPQQKENRSDPTPDMNALCEALEPLISEAIARKARQRRYTP